MVPTDDYPTVPHKATLKEALVALERAGVNSNGQGGTRPRAVLVVNDKQRVIGKLTHWDVLRALEPKYQSMGDARTLSHCGWSASFIKSMVRSYGLFDKPLDNVCAEAAKLQVRDVMTPVSEEELLHHEKEIVEHDVPLNEGIHLLVMGNLMFLYVRKKGRIVGIIRLSDVFRMISETIQGSS